jgi:hypothetical protein
LPGSPGRWEPSAALAAPDGFGEEEDGEAVADRVEDGAVMADEAVAVRAREGGQLVWGGAVEGLLGLRAAEGGEEGLRSEEAGGFCGHGALNS